MNQQNACVALVSACLVLGGTATAAGKDPFVGTWKLDIARSTFDNGAPPKSSIVTITTAGDKRKVAVHTVSAAGTESRTESTAADDGKDYPMKGSATVDTVAVTRVDARTVDRKDKKGGAVVATLRVKVSPDGKTITVTQKGIDPQGRSYNNTLVYARQ
jgi:hypothetical protein